MRQDPLPLFINVDYLKEPRYFSLSFRKMFNDIFDKQDLGLGFHELKLSKPETVEIFASGCPDREATENLLYVKNKLETAKGMDFAKEVYVKGDTVIGKENELRALACDGTLQVGCDTYVSRWLDAEGMIEIEENCSLGISVTTGKQLIIKKKCRFKRLYGFPVMTGKLRHDAEQVPQGEYLIYECKESADIKEIPAGSKNDFSVITVHELQVGANSVVNGHIKSYQSIVVADNVLITGNIFSDGDISIGENCVVLGNIFSQGRVELNTGATVGQKGKIKSVIGNSSIVLSRGVTVHGYVSTDGEGFVV